MLKLVKIPVWSIIVILLGVIGSMTGLVYAKDVSKIDDNDTRITTIETTYNNKYVTKTEFNQTKKELNTSLSKKVNKDAFQEFKEGQEKIIKAINDNHDRELIYQKIIKDMSCADTIYNGTDLVMK